MSPETWNQFVKESGLSVRATLVLRLTPLQARCLESHFSATIATAVCGTDLRWAKQICKKLEKQNYNIP